MKSVEKPGRGPLMSPGRRQQPIRAIDDMTINYYKLRNASPSCKALIPFTDMTILFGPFGIYSSSSFI